MRNIEHSTSNDEHRIGDACASSGSRLPRCGKPDALFCARSEKLQKLAN
jgi:hypothetical protein